MMTLLLLFDGLHLRSTSDVSVKQRSVSVASKSINVCSVVAIGWSNLHLRSISTLSA